MENITDQRVNYENARDFQLPETTQAPNFLPFFFLFFYDFWKLLFSESRSLGTLRRFPRLIYIDRRHLYKQEGREGVRRTSGVPFSKQQHRGGVDERPERDIFFEVPFRFGLETFVKRGRGDGGAFYAGPKSKNDARSFDFFSLLLITCKTRVDASFATE